MRHLIQQLCTRKLAKAISFALLALLVGCATPPSSGGFADAPASLEVCSGTRVSNAPSKDRRGKIREFTPYKTVRGVALMRAPVIGCLSSGFGPRRGGAGSIHKGIDIYTGRPRAVHAAAGGRVAQIGSLRGFGRTILIRHANGVETRYAHLSSYAAGLKKGARVRAGAVIAKTGRTGNATAVHLHYEILNRGRAINPLK